jgi:cytochrome c peroxidase
MRQIKLIISLLFVCLSLAALFTRTGSVPVAAQESIFALAAPTEVTASDSDYVNKVGIHWDAIRGATLYRVYRNTSDNSGSATEVGATAANYFFDASAPQGTNFYWVRAENSTETSGFSNSDQGTRGIGTIIPGQLSPLEPPPAPAGNELTAAKSYLGKTLFWDEQLSSTKTVACGTCHRPAAGGSDPRTAVGSNRSRNPGHDNAFGTADDVFGSPGVPLNLADGNYLPSPLFGFREQVTGRKSPSYLNSGYSPNGLFWDGRALDAFRDQLTNAILLPMGASLESQSAGPPLSSAEMAHGGRTWAQAAARIQNSRPLALASRIPAGLKTWIGERTYTELFQEAFGTPDVTPARISMAIASHERTLFSDRTPLDRWAAQIEPLTPSEERGRVVFSEAACNICHSGPLLSDNQFHNIGVRPQFEDIGRGAVTNNTDDDARFRTPTLRNGELHAPFMHNGRFATLEEVVEFYDRGGDFKAPNIDSIIRPLKLTGQQKADLVAFLKRPLTDPRVTDELPPFDRPQLFTESDRVPVISGVGRPGIAGSVPDAIAIEPPLLGNPNFNIAVTVSPRQGKAVVIIDDVDPGIRTSIPASASFLRAGAEIFPLASGGGYATLNIAIPNDPGLIGRTFYGRWYIQDIRARGRIAVSRLFSFTVFKAETAPASIGWPSDSDRSK